MTLSKELLSELDRRFIRGFGIAPVLQVSAHTRAELLDDGNWVRLTPRQRANTVSLVCRLRGGLTSGELAAFLNRALLDQDEKVRVRVVSAVAGMISQKLVQPGTPIFEALLVVEAVLLKTILKMDSDDRARVGEFYAEVSRGKAD